MTAVRRTTRSVLAALASGALLFAFAAPFAARASELCSIPAISDPSTGMSIPRPQQCFSSQSACASVHGACACTPSDCVATDAPAAPETTFQQDVDVALGVNEPYAPALQIPIPDVHLTQINLGQGDEEYLTIPWIGEYIAGVYDYAVSFAGILAGVMIVIGGYRILTAGGDAAKVTRGRQNVTDALTGLALVLGAYVILNTVSPDLTKLTPIRVERAQRMEFTAEQREDWGDHRAPTDGTTAQRACSTIEECRALCAKPRAEWPTSTAGMLDPSQASPIPNLPGLDGNGRLASRQVIEGLTRAANIANQQGMTIVVTDGYRSLESQISLVCGLMGSPDAEAGIGKNVAWPGGSNHGAGYAIDIQLRDRAGNTLVGSGSCARQADGNSIATVEHSRLLDRIMTEAGARRYKNEVWHYEFGGGSDCRCQFPNCPPPPLSCRAGC